MTDTTIDVNVKADEKQRPGLSRIFAGGLAGGLTSWLLTWGSLHGMDFTTAGIDSEYVKGAITGTLTGFFVAPDTVVFMLRDVIIWFYNSAKILSKAAKEGKE